MNSRPILTALLLAGLTLAPLAAASAERVKQGGTKANAAFTACSDGGGTIQESGGVTSCIAGNGHGIVCGGPKPDHKGTCDTFRRAPKRPWHITPEELARVNVVKPMKATKPVKRMAP